MLAEELASRRRERLVGRAAEIELFRQALERCEPPFPVLHVHGPGGIGKTSLLEVFAGSAVDAGARVVRLDGQEMEPPRVAMRRALDFRGESSLTEASSSRNGAGSERRLVVLIDGYEHLAELDDWLRTEFLPGLPPSTVTVLAGREPPRAAWRADPAWRDLLAVAPLRNLSATESREYLARCGVEPELRERIVARTYGHPLGLSLLADAALRGGAWAVEPLPRDVVGALVQRFVEVVPGGWQRRALAVCALARATSEPLLRAVLDEGQAREAFEWLAGLPCVEPTADGLAPHELARDALASDLRWRDLDLFRHVFRRVRAHLQERLGTAQGREVLRAVSDFKFLYRGVPIEPSPIDWSVWGRHYPEPAGVDDRPAIVAIAEASEGEESGAVVRRWLHRQPEAFTVVRRGDGRVRGFLALLDLTVASQADREADPGAQAAWDHAHRVAPPRPGEMVTQLRFVIDADAYQDPSPTLNAAPLLTNERYLTVGVPAWDFLTLQEPKKWDAYFAAADFPRAQGADFVVGNGRFGLYAHDFRRVPLEVLLERWSEQALRQDPALDPAPATAMLVLDEEEFSDAVRQALRNLHRPDLLADNPLLRTGLLRQRAASGEPDAALLEDLLGEAIKALRAHPRDDKLFQALQETYLRPAPTQEAAARALGLPFSTYRRHLTQGVTRVRSWLWQQETGNGSQTRAAASEQEVSNTGQSMVW